MEKILKQIEDRLSDILLVLIYLIRKEEENKPPDKNQIN